jgi:hypothetical protein
MQCGNSVEARLKGHHYQRDVGVKGGYIWNAFGSREKFQSRTGACFPNDAPSQ